MPIEIKINDSQDPKARYITYAPSRCQLRQTPAAAPLTVTLSSRAANTGGGEAVFYESRTVGTAPTPTLTLTLPADGTWVDFAVGGRFGKPSVDDGDCLLLVTSAGDTLTVPLMVRVRKNANKLKARERDRFLLALAKLNVSAGLTQPSAYQTLRNMHLVSADREQHGGPHFLPWHRSYLLDIERKLQAIDPSVAMHYWRFDEPAPNVFSQTFMGETRRAAIDEMVVLHPDNPLNAWVVDGGVAGISRSALFDTVTQAAPGPPGFGLLTQAQTLALGAAYPGFSQMEGTPHGAAHVSFNGPITEKDTAPKDPLFFMLHSNVDRLWALWQWMNRRTDATDPRAYRPQNQAGRRTGDTMWPWNGEIGFPRPDFAPGNGLPPSPLTSAPGSQPTVGQMLDYHASRIGTPDAWLGFSYDDVPFEFTA